MQKSIRLFAALGALAVALGAFGAHGLKSLVAPEQLETFGTGVRYHFYHAFAIGISALLMTVPGFSKKNLGRAITCFWVGILLFSGSLYLLSLRDVHGLPVGILGPITPLGGLLFIVGWVFVILSPGKSSSHA